MALTLVRHTAPDIAADVCYGRSDVDVAHTFDQDARDVAACLAPPRFIISSPLRRCQKLAAALGSHFALPFKIDDRLSEMDFGRWEGQNWGDIPRSELDAWAADLAGARPHGGESVAMLYARAKAALADYREDDSLLVTHSGVIKCALARSVSASELSTQVAFGASVSPLL